VDGEPLVTHDESYTDNIFGVLYCNVSWEIFTYSVAVYITFFSYIFKISVPFPKQ